MTQPDPTGTAGARISSAVDPGAEHNRDEIGCVEEWQSGIVSGWVASKQDLSRRLQVGIVVDGEVIAVIRASKFREDLRAQGIGDGRFGFAFPIAEYLTGPASTVQVVVAGSGAVVSPGSMSLRDVQITVPGFSIPDDASEIDRLQERALSRWRRTESPTGLTWGRTMTGDSFIDEVSRFYTCANGAHLCELGPGYGRLLKTITEKSWPFSSFTGIELSASRVEALRAEYGSDPRISFIEGDINTFSLETPIDMVMSSATFEHLFPDCSAGLKNIAGCLVPNGWVFIDFVQLEDDMRRSVHWFEPVGSAFIHVYSRNELQGLFEAEGLRVNEITSIVLGTGLLGHGREEPVRRIFVAAQKSGEG